MGKVNPLLSKTTLQNRASSKSGEARLHTVRRVHSLEALRPFGHHLPDPPTPDDRNRLALQLLPHKLLPLPLASLHGDVRFRDPPVVVDMDKSSWIRGRGRRLGPCEAGDRRMACICDT